MKQKYNLATGVEACENALSFTYIKSLLIAVVMLLGVTEGFGQVANYTFSESAGTYTAITGTTAHASAWDDGVTGNTIPIGFTFNFNGTNYTTCSINTNGYITFGTTISASNLYTPISNGTGYAGAISAVGFDLISNASTITYTTTGIAPNRIFIAQWNNARRYSLGAIAGDFNFQIRLSETTNLINIVYGVCAPATNTVYNVQVGLRGAANTDFNNRSLITNTIWDVATGAGGVNNATCRTRSNAYPNTGRTFTWTPPTPPTITSFTPSNGCASSSQTVVITGTNFTGVTAVTIGGTAAASYIVNSATQITATIGTGTTGTIQVTTPAGSATSAGSFTVNPLPAAIAGGAATVCTGANSPAFTNATAGGTWSIINGTGSATINAATGVATGVTAGTVSVVYTLPTSCATTTSLTVITVPTTAGTPTPANAAAGICFAGIGAVTSVSWTAVASATNYDVYFGAGSVPGAVTANVLTNTYNTGALAANTTYFWRIVAKNACGNAVTSATFTFTTASGPCYCASSGSTYPNGITGVNFNSINNLGTTVNTGYTNFTAISTTVVKGFPYNLNIFLNTGGNFTDHQSVYIDWNGNGSFVDAGEFYNLGTANNVTNGLSSLSPLSITIPVGAITGSVRMRVQSRYSAATTGPCQTVFDGEVEDYTIIITDPVPCVNPTAQPTALALTSNGGTINGAFTAASPVPNNYLVVLNTTGVAPTPVNGTTYGIGSSALGGTNVVIDNDSNTSFSATSLTPFTTHYFFVYSINNYCTSGPLYLTTSPLTGNATTDYCVPSVGATYENLVYFTNIAFVGTLNDVSNSSTYSSSPIGYQNFSALPNRSQQAQGQGINISTQTSSRGYLKAWVDWNKDGDFADAGEKVYDVGGNASYSTTFGFIIPAAQAIGNYRIRIRINKDDNVTFDPNAISAFDSCQNINYYGETEDYEFTVVASCSAYITGVTDGLTCGSGTVTLAATSTGGATEYRWYNSEFGGTPITTTVAGTWTTPVISATTTYWVSAFNGCESLVRTKITANVNPVATITFTPSVPEVCGENQVLSLTAAGDVQQTYLVNEPFNSGLGVMTNLNIVNNGAVRNGITSWQNQTSTFVPAQQVWFPAISSGINGNSFAMSTSDIGTYITHNAILTPTVSTNTYLNLNLSFDIFYSRYYIDGTNLGLDYAVVEVSTDGGASWPVEIDRYTADQGYGTRFVNKTYNLNSYINYPNFRVRIRYYGEWCDGLAIDNFKLYGDIPLNTSFDWSSMTPVAAFTNAACSIPYTTGTPITTVFIKPTLTQLEDVNYSFTATANLSNGCSVSQNVSIANKSKIWKGGTNGDWSTANNWLPVGVPDATNCVIIPTAPNNSVVGGTNFNGLGKTLQVIETGNLTINPTNSLTITDFVEVRDLASVFNIENSGSLVQINDVANLGNINYKRIAPGIRGFDYVYWSSPVSNQTMETIYSSPVSGPKYAWNTTVPNTNAGLGNWESASGVMQRAKGYIIRGSSSYGMPATNIAASFTGVPHNGIIPFTVARGTYTGIPYNGTNGIQITNLDDNHNLLGNPYPSAIDVVDFLSQNNAVIHGNVRLWRHLGAPATIVNPFYGSFTYNYNGDDYLTINNLGNSDPVGTAPIIKSGQAFLVQMLDGPAATGTVNFTNSMRLKTGIPLNNGTFFKTSDAIASTEPLEKHRIWLNLMDQNNIVSSMLVGYATGASDAFDSPFDARSSVPNFMKLYSLIDNDVYDIQGKSLPFNNNDQVPLGITTVQAGTYSIGLNTIDGLFLDANQEIYLEDKTTNIIHNLKTNPYSFTSAAGTFHNRFVLRYTNETLGNDDFVTDAATVWLSSANELTVKSSKIEIKSVRVFDILGSELANYDNVNGYELPLTKIQKNNSGLIIQITLANGAVVSKKAIY